VIANREANLTRDLYQHLLQRSNEVGLLSGMRAGNISVLDPAHTSAEPVTPKKFLILVLGLGVGLVFGLAVIFLWDSLDPALHEAEEMRVLTGLPVFGVLPRSKGEGLLSAHAAGGFSVGSSSANEPFLEAFRSIRTLLSHAATTRSLKSFVVTSPGPGEGKTTVAFNLAVAMAHQNKQVLLVDADLRHGTLSKALGLSSAAGLSERITDGANIEPKLVAGSQRLFFLPAGLLPDSPTEALALDSFPQMLLVWKSQFDYVVIDTMPILSATDAVVCTTLVDGVVLVALLGATAKSSIAESDALLQGAGAVLIGSVLNQAPRKIA